MALGLQLTNVDQRKTQNRHENRFHTDRTRPKPKSFKNFRQRPNSKASTPNGPGAKLDCGDMSPL